MNLQIRVPVYAKSELVYTIDTLMSMAFVEESHSYSTYDFPWVEIQCGDKVIFFHQSFFFGEGRGPDQWYSSDQLPSTPIFFKPEIFRDELLLLYGESADKLEGNQYTVKADIFGSAFFMLSRWEEYVVNDRDQHGRFDAEKAFSVRNGIIRRPIVNEYAMYLRSCLEWLGLILSPIQGGKVTLSFDIDYIYKWKSLRNLFGAWKRNFPHLQQCWSDTTSYLRSWSNKKDDPYYQIPYLLQSLDKKGINAVFFIKAENYQTAEDNADYLPGDTDVQPSLVKILASGYQIGLHPSYRSFEQPELIAQEKKMLELAIHRKITLVRNHFLRIDLPKTYREYLNAGFTTDSSAMYTRYPGFRNGTCSSFTFFDFRKRAETSLKVVPLAAMMYEDLGNEAEHVKEDMVLLSNLVHQYGGDAMILWHNSDLDTLQKKQAFEDLLDKISVL